MPATDRRHRDPAVPPVVVEALRFCVVIFLSGLGYQAAQAFPDADVDVGWFDEVGVSTLLGAAVGYVLGGVVGRTTGRTLQAAEALLLGRSVEQVLAGLLGAIIGVVAGAALTWPLLLLGQPLTALPLLAFVCVTTGSLGYRIGVLRRESVLSLFGPPAGLTVPPTPLAALPRILDSSVAIDGRLLAVVRAGFLHGTLLVPQPVLDELQGLADAADDARRGRGRRGLAAIEALRRERGVDLEVIGDEAPEVAAVDAKIVRMALDRKVALLTLDSNLAKTAALAGCRVMNLHALTLALRPPVTAGDTADVMLTRPGKEPGQAVGYLDDGTMVVVEKARGRIGHEIHIVVTSVLTTANGRMVFARGAADSGAPAPEAVPHPR